LGKQNCIRSSAVLPFSLKGGENQWNAIWGLIDRGRFWKPTKWKLYHPNFCLL